MLPTGQLLLGAASEYQMVRYDQETNSISATSSYRQDISNRTRTILLACPVVFAITAIDKNNNTQDSIMVPHHSNK